MGLEFGAIARAVADAGGTPLVVHGPYNPLTAPQNFSKVAHAQHSLVNPMQMNYICLFKTRQFGDIDAGIGRVYLEQAFF